MEDMTPKAKIYYDSASSIFEEHGDASCELDTLDNYHDFLKACDDDFLDLFAISYNTELDDWEDNADEYFTGPTYNDPSIILTPLKPCSFGKIYITCRGYETSNGFYITCEVNENNTQKGKECVDWLKNQMNIGK